MLKNQMVKNINAIEPENRTNETATIVFREVLSHRSGYTRELGEMAMLESLNKSLGSVDVWGHHAMQRITRMSLRN